MKKPNFPSRPCPKCGKYIHTRSKSHEDCGWTESSAISTSKGKTATNGKPMSKMEAVRRILAESGNDTKPLDIQAQLKKKFNLKMEPTVISSYKTTIFAKSRKKSGVIRKLRVLVPARASTSGTITIEDIKAVKDLAERLGAEKVRQLAEVLAK